MRMGFYFYHLKNVSTIHINLTVLILNKDIFLYINYIWHSLLSITELLHFLWSSGHWVIYVVISQSYMIVLFSLAAISIVILFLQLTFQIILKLTYTHRHTHTICWSLNYVHSDTGVKFQQSSLPLTAWLWETWKYSNNALTHTHTHSPTCRPHLFSIWLVWHTACKPVETTMEVCMAEREREIYNVTLFLDFLCCHIIYVCLTWFGWLLRIAMMNEHPICGLMNIASCLFLMVEIIYRVLE